MAFRNCRETKLYDIVWQISCIVPRCKWTNLITLNGSDIFIGLVSMWVLLWPCCSCCLPDWLCICDSLSFVSNSSQPISPHVPYSQTLKRTYYSLFTGMHGILWAGTSTELVTSDPYNYRSLWFAWKRLSLKIGVRSAFMRNIDLYSDIIEQWFTFKFYIQFFTCAYYDVLDI